VNFSHLDPLLEQQPSELIGGLHPERRPLDTVCFIYTSGTTGLPKASLITNLRFYMTGFAFSSSFQMKPTDKTYCSLPLYHASALFLGLSCSWFVLGVQFTCFSIISDFFGRVVKSSVVIRSKFSASKFWVDCAKQGCTIGLYIGEICRYLMAVPPCAEDTGHKYVLLHVDVDL
jgi:solute carrier family 27 fatty acid transporter 1/4